MRMMMLVQCPIEPFNTLVRNGTAGSTMKKILDDIKPEAAYFGEREGKRGGILIVDLQSPSDVPRLAEPWFLWLQRRSGVQGLHDAGGSGQGESGSAGQEVGLSQRGSASRRVGEQRWLVLSPAECELVGVILRLAPRIAPPPRGLRPVRGDPGPGATIFCPLRGHAAPGARHVK